MQKAGIILTIVASLFLASCSSSKKAVAVRRPGEVQMVGNYVYSTDKQVSELIRQARTWIGTPYSYGGHTRKKGTDCSGMIMELFLNVYNLKLPRSSAMQREYARPIKYEDMKPGDLIFFTTGKNATRVNHVGLYIGDNRMIHASGSRGVMESTLGDKYWQNAYHSSGSVITTKGKKKQKEAPAKVLVPSVSVERLQELYNSLDEQIDSIYVSDPSIFD